MVMVTALTILITRGRERGREAIAPGRSPPHIAGMEAEGADNRTTRSRPSRAGWTQIPLVRHALVTLGFLLIALTPLVGPIPGPGGIIVFGAGLSLILKYTGWAKRLYVRFKRKHPNKGRWADWSLRRASARRREALHRAIAAGSVVEGGREQTGDD
jgi:hypothetical protein